MEKEVMLHNKSQATTAEWLSMGLDFLLGMLGSDRAYQRVFGKVWRYYFKNPREALPADKAWLKGIRAKAINLTRRSIIKINNEELRPDLSRLDIPIQLLFGSDDIYGASSKQWLSRWPNAKQMTLNNVGHLPWIQGKQEFIRILEGFYGNLGGSTSE